jgi:hypothetical protein
MIVLFLREAEMLILDLGVALMYCLAAVLGLGIPPPTIFTDVVFTLDALLACDTTPPLEGGLIVEFLLPFEIIELLL